MNNHDTARKRALLADGVRFLYTCSECGALADHRRESEAPKQTLGKFHCAVHPKARVKREPAKRGMA